MQGFRFAILVRAVVCAAAVCLVAPAFAAPEDDYNLAVGLYQKDRWEGAAESFRKFLLQNPQHPRAEAARLYLGLALVNLGDNREARDVLREFVRLYPRSKNLPDALYRIGETSYSLGDFQQAETDLLTFLDRYPDHELTEWALPYVADAQLRLDKPKEAATHFRQALEKHPDGTLIGETKFGLARAHEALDRPDDAAALYRELAAGTGPRAPAAQLRVATLLYDAEKYDEAATEFVGLAERFPQSPLVPTARLNAGFAFYRGGDFDRAIEQLEAAASNKEEAAVATHWIGMARKAQGDADGAAKAFAAVVESHADAPIADESLFHWADSALRAGQYEQAATLFERVAAGDPAGPHASDSVYFAGEAALLAGDLDRATVFVERFQRDYGRTAYRMHNRLLAGRVFEARARQAGTPPAEKDRLEQQALAEFAGVLDETEVAATQAKARFEIARLRERRAEPDEALAALAPLLDEIETQDAPGEFVDALIIAARAYLSRNEPEQAIAQATKYLELAPEGDQADAALATRAVAQVTEGGADAAEADWTALRERFPKSDLIIPTTRDLAERAYDAKDWKSAAEFFTGLGELAAGSQEEAIGLSGLGWSLHKAGRFAESAAAFGRLLERFPEAPQLAPEAAYMQGKALQDAGELAAAAEAYRKAFERFAPGQPATAGQEATGPERNAYLAGLQRARVLRLLNKPADADAAYAALIEKFPRPRNLDELLEEWALLHYENEDYARADELFRRLLKETPDSPLASSARLSLAESALFSGHIDQARTDLEQIADDKQAPAATRQRALSLLVSLAAERGDWKSTESLARRFLERQPGAEPSGSDRERPLVTYQLGEALLQQGQSQKAAEILAEVEQQRDAAAVRAAPWFPRVYVLLAEAAFQQKDYAAATAHLDRIEAFDPQPDYAYMADELRGRIYKNQAEFDEARAAFQRVLDDPNARRTETAARAQYDIAQTYFLQQRWEEARTAAFKVYTLYKFPEWQAPALYMAGLSDEALGETQKAAAAFGDVVKEFPESPYAEQAREKLAKLGRKAG